LNVPNVPINDIKIHHKDLVIATQGRSMWILDDITPLHQIAAQTASSASVLFKPRDAIRARIGGGRGGFGGGGGAALSGQAQFPPNGAPVNYFLGRAPSGPISIDIQDAAGKVIRHYSSEATAAATNADEPAAASNDDEGPAF